MKSFNFIDRSVKLKKQTNKVLFSLFRYFMLLVIGFIVLYPLIYMLCNAFKSERAVIDVSRIWIPRYISLDNFKRAYAVLDFANSIKRTFSLQVVSALIEVFTCSAVAYGFARFKFRGKKIAMAVLILTLLIPVQMYSLSLAINYRNLDFLGVFGLIKNIAGVDLRLNIYNTDFTFWLPSLFGVGFRSGMIIYIYIQFFSGLPFELEDAAYVDGAGLFTTFFRIALPSSSVVIVTVTLLSVIWHWNESFLSSLCFLAKEWPLSAKLYDMEKMLGRDGIYLFIYDGKGVGTVLAGCLLFVIIPLVVYIFLQRKFVKSIDRVGITG